MHMKTHMALSFFLMALLLPFTARAETFTGEVVQLVSGAIIVVQHADARQELRLYGVDVPEPGQDHADAARNHIRRHALNKQVRVEPRGRDNTGRLVALVHLPDNTVLNHALIEQGLAWWDTRNVPSDHQLMRLGATAILAGRGLWEQGMPQSPWEYRESNDIPSFTYQKEELAPAPVVEVEETGENEITITVNPDDFDVYDNLNYLELMARHRPRLVRDAEGQPLGITASEIAEIPGASLLGFGEGDVIHAVNGVKLISEAQIFLLVQQFQGAKQLEVDVLRDGNQRRITLKLP